MRSPLRWPRSVAHPAPTTRWRWHRSPGSVLDCGRRAMPPATECRRQRLSMKSSPSCRHARRAEERNCTPACGARPVRCAGAYPRSTTAGAVASWHRELFVATCATTGHGSARDRRHGLSRAMISGSRSTIRPQPASRVLCTRLPTVGRGSVIDPRVRQQRRLAPNMVRKRPAMPITC